LPKLKAINDNTNASEYSASISMLTGKYF